MPRKKMNTSSKSVYVGENSIFATRLRELIELSNMTQQEVADKVGVQRQTVSLYTKGKALPDISTLARLADVFHVDSDFLLGRCGMDTSDENIKKLAYSIRMSEKAVKWLMERRMGGIISDFFECDNTYQFFVLLQGAVYLRQERGVLRKSEDDFLRYMQMNLRIESIVEELAEFESRRLEDD